MIASSQKIITKINKLLALMKLSDDKLSIYYLEFLEYSLLQLNKPHDPVKIAENILRAYGGMGTFSDTGIWKNGNPLYEEDKKYSMLRTELFIICEKIVAQSRIYNNKLA